MRLIWSRRAIDGLRDIQVHLDAMGTGAGARAAERVLSTVDTLHDFPRIGRSYGRSGARLLVVARTPFLIRYDLGQDRIEIVDVFHGGRPWHEPD